MHQQCCKWDCTAETASAADIKMIIKCHNYADASLRCNCRLMLTLITAVVAEL